MTPKAVPEVKVEGDFSGFNISAKLIERLRAKGIERLFPVQARTFDLICSGSDVVVLARTGTGKTLAFALPIIQTLLVSRNKDSAHNKLPKVLVLAPTRELVSQISSEFSSICATDFTTLAVYGGVPIHTQRQSLRQGVDILVATPGRVIDLIERGAVSLNSIKHVVLDEVDRMLDMGFAQHVESIISQLYEKSENSASPAASKPQTLLFSATLPNWVSSVASKYLDENAHHVSLIDEQQNQTALTVTHLALPCPYEERASTIADVIRAYCSRPESRCIVFCERKKDADELAAHSAMSSDCHVLHGDVPQDKRELVLNKFREGKYRTLVTTNVAARGLDIPEVDLVIQCHPPRDIEDYIHRSGRTGRADRSGTSVVFHTANERSLLHMIESKTGIEFRRISAPTLHDIVDSWGDGLTDAFTAIPEETWSAFLPTARKLIRALRASDGSPGKKSKQDQTNGDSDATTGKQPKSALLLRALCCSLAHLNGNSNITEPRSLLTARRGWVTYQLKLSKRADRKGLAYSVLRQQIGEDVTESIKNMSFIKGHTGFVFDVPANLNDAVVSSWKNDDSATLEPLKELPELELEPGDMMANRSSYGNSFRGNQNGFRSGGRGGGAGFRNHLSFGNGNKRPYSHGFGANRGGFQQNGAKHMKFSE